MAATAAAAAAAATLGLEAVLDEIAEFGVATCICGLVVVVGVGVDGWLAEVVVIPRLGRLQSRFALDFKPSCRGGGCKCVLRWLLIASRFLEWLILLQCNRNALYLAASTSINQMQLKHQSANMINDSSRRVARYHQISLIYR
jgi:hypothetical protein